MTTAGGSSAESGFGPLAIAVALLRHWKMVVIAPIVIVGATVVLLLEAPLTYTASTSFVPETGGGSSGISQLLGAASSVGLLGSALGANRSSAFYADLLQSRPIVYGVLQTRLVVPPGMRGGVVGDTASLLEIWGVAGATPAARLDRGYRMLFSSIRLTTDRVTGIVSLSVDGRSPQLIAEIANAFVAQLEHFNETSRQSQARARRIFASARADSSEQALERAEDALQTFYQRNRQFRDSPALVFEEQRLQRQIGMQQQIYVSLRQEADMARIQEANDVPVFTVIERAEPPIRHSKPQRKTIVTYMAALSVLGAAAYAVLRDLGLSVLGLTPEVLAALRGALPRPLRGKERA